MQRLPALMGATGMFAVQFTMSVVEVRGLRRPFDFAYAAGVFKLLLSY